MGKYSIIDIGNKIRKINYVSNDENNKEVEDKAIALNEIINKCKDKIENLIWVSESEKDINTFKLIMHKNKSMNISAIKCKRKSSPLIMEKEIKYHLENINSIIGTRRI